MFMRYIADLVTCYKTRYVASFSCYMAKVVYNQNVYYTTHPNLPDVPCWYKNLPQICTYSFST